MSDFMHPQVFQGTFIRVEVDNGECLLTPEEDFDISDIDKWTTLHIERETGFFVRLSAPGYMDCTEWDGPYESEGEAMEAINDLYCEE